MSIIKKCIAFLGYLLITSALANFEFTKLFDLKQIAVTFLGAYMLYIPANGVSIHKNSLQFGQCALTASYIQTFVLIFFQFSTTQNINTLIPEIALNCRPLLYGFFLWVVLQNKQIPHSSSLPKELSVEQLALKLTSLGLTKREAEVALQVNKGLTNAEIAFDLCISETTVKKHLSNIFEKLNISKREQLKEFFKK